MKEWIEPGPDFRRLVTGFARTAWRWECQGTYREPSEQEPFRLWREGRSDASFLDGWLGTVRGFCAEGRTFERVRMVTQPPTEYLRWQFSLTGLNVEAGEDIRWLSEADAKTFGAPTFDYYLLDDDLVVVMQFGDGGVAGAEVTDDPSAVEEAQRWRTVAWAHATPHTKYMSRST
ncbi:MAG: DUF6879 family protein [Haloechinothrix sp.]